jgi:hypothetical protein
MSACSSGGAAEHESALHLPRTFVVFYFFRQFDDWKRRTPIGANH